MQIRWFIEQSPRFKKKLEFERKKRTSDRRNNIVVVVDERADQKN